MSTDLKKEVAARYPEFCEEVDSSALAAITAHDHAPTKFQECFTLGASIGAWHDSKTLTNTPEAALAFYIEARNDLVVSLALARSGHWRAAQQCLRGFIEGILCFCYYKDHLVELERWKIGFKVSAAELKRYLEDHPRLQHDSLFGAVQMIKAEYDELCFSVHGSRHSHRMTKFGFPALSVVDTKALGLYHSTFMATVRGTNLLLLQLYQESLAATGDSHLRSHLRALLGKKNLAKASTLLSIKL
jgi:hypothetical protein